MKFREETVRDALRDAAGTQPDAENTHAGRTADAPTIVAEPPLIERKKEAKKERLTPLAPSSLRSEGSPPSLFAPGDLPEPQRITRKPDTAWVEAFLAELRTVANLRLDGMSPAQRLILARGFAYHVGNCRTNERTNRARAASVAKGLGSLVYSEFGGWNGARWLMACVDARKLAGDVPTFDPWCFKAVLESPCQTATA